MPTSAQYDPTGMQLRALQSRVGQVDESGRRHGVCSSGTLRRIAADTIFASFEVGPAVLRPDGTRLRHRNASAAGAGHTAIYSNTGAGQPGPDFPDSSGHRRRTCCAGAQRQRSHDGKPVDLQYAIDLLRVGRDRL